MRSKSAISPRTLVHAFMAFVGCLWIILGRCKPIQAQPAIPAATSTPDLSWYSVHVQATNTQQYHGSFASQYQGVQSLSATPETAKTFDATLFLGARVWKGGAVYLDPELDQGFGLNNTFGVAGYPSAEAYKVGDAHVYGRLQRYYVQQTINVKGPLQSVSSDQNQIPEMVAERHLTLTFGKYGVTDIFDANPYAHDSKNDFLNWSILDMGSFDYAADAWGYTRGFTAELSGARSSVKAGIFQLSTIPNTTSTSPQFLRQYSPILEYERKTSFFGGHPGSYKILAYGDDGYMGSYADALAAATPENTPSTADVRQGKHWKLGGGANFSQEIAPHIGVFGRYSGMNGSYEAFEFTDIDRSASLGVSIDGGLYRRPNDRIGLAEVVNSISVPARQYFAAGGLGVLIGDGALSYDREQIVEGYYRLGFSNMAAITLDDQYIVNPGYNMARGPVSIWSVRYHIAK